MLSLCMSRPFMQCQKKSNGASCWAFYRYAQVILVQMVIIFVEARTDDLCFLCTCAGTPLLWHKDGLT